jgi:hypothetical protein
MIRVTEPVQLNDSGNWTGDINDALAEFGRQRSQPS